MGSRKGRVARRLAAVAGAAVALACTGCGPERAEKREALAAFCASTEPLDWTPEAGPVVVYARSDDDGAPGRWYEASSTTPEGRDPRRGADPAYIACLDHRFETLGAEEYTLGGERTTTLRRQRAHTTLRVYRLHDAELLSEAQLTGPEPPRFADRAPTESAFRGDIAEEAIRNAIGAAIGP